MPYNEMTGMVVTAVYNFKYADKLFIKDTEITQESREKVFRIISPESITSFLNDFRMDYSRVKNPTAYLQTSLYTYHQQLLQPSQAEPVSTDTPEQPLADWKAWEQNWRARVRAHIRSQAQETE